MKQPVPGRSLILVDKWFAENTFHADEFADLKQLMELKDKQGSTISLALPALNEGRDCRQGDFNDKKSAHG